MLTQVCRELNNWFYTVIHTGQWTIENGQLDLSGIVADGDLRDGQHFRIVGSIFNDGVYTYPVTETLSDEVFNGGIWCMAVPKEVLDLVDAIEQWCNDYAKELNSPYQSESFGGYSYSLKTVNSSSGGGSVTWQDHFKSQLNKWRKI